MAGLQRAVFVGFAIVSIAQQVNADDPKDDKKNAPKKVSYYNDIRPIFQQHCQGCHQPAQQKGDYVMTAYDALFKKGSQDKPGVVKNHPEKSLVVEQITSDNGKPPAMPRGKDPLTDQQVKQIKSWIAQGATDDTPASAREKVIDMQHPPSYSLAPVITTLDYSPDGKLIATSGYHEVLINKTDGTLVARLVGTSERIESLQFSPDGKHLAVSGGSPGRFGEIQVWDYKKKLLRLSLPLTYDTIFGLCWSPDSKQISFGCADNSLRVIDANKGKQVLFQGGHSDWVLDSVFSKDGKHLISVSRDRSMKLTEVKTARLVDNITSITPGALKGGLISVASHPKEDQVACGGADGIPKLYRIFRNKARKIGDDYNLIRKFPGMPGRIYAIEFSRDGSKIVAGSSGDNKGFVRVFDTKTGKQIAAMEGDREGVFAVAFDPVGKHVASAGFDGTVRIHDAKTGALIRQYVPCPLAPQASAKARNP